MSDMSLLWVMGVVSIVLILLLILFQQKYALLHKILHKTTEDYNQLASKFDGINSLKNQLEQQIIKAQTESQGLLVRLNERDEKIHYLTQELDEEQARHSTIAEQITALKERFGIASAQAESLNAQLQHSQSQLSRKEQEQQHLTEKLTALSQELTGLKTTLAEKEKHFSAQQQNFEQSKQQLGVEFQNLANRILDEKSRSFSQSNQTALETLLKPFREQIEGFQKRVNEIHSESVKGNAGLEAEIKKVLEIGLNMSQEASNLTSALKGEKKTLGNWGEVQLERALQLAGLEENVHYRAQAHFKDEQGGRNYPDFVLNLPDEKHLIIDSKMSLVAYESAVNSDDDFERERLLKEHISALKSHINDLHKKDYSNLIGMRSPNFVLMFIAVEPAYIEALKSDPALFNYGYERNVIMVSHTTLMPILRTVANLWRIERGNAEAKEIAEKAGEIYNQICLVAERLSKLGNTLSTVSNQYNSTVLMFIAVEPAYIEALKSDPALFNYGYERNVIMVSHTTLMPILRTVANLWRIERGNAEAKEIAEKAGEIYNQICLVAERLSKLGNTLSTVSNQYNSTVTALVGQQGLVGKVERFKTLSAKANKTMPDVELLNNQIDLARLDTLN